MGRGVLHPILWPNWPAARAGSSARPERSPPPVTGAVMNWLKEFAHETTLLQP